MGGILLRWSWRDLRARWVQVVVIALIIALGTGSYAGLVSTTDWREQSNEASFEATNVFDVRAELSAGSFVPAGTLLGALADLDGASLVDAAEERLIVPTQVEADGADEEVLVAGRLIGVDVRAGGPHVNGVFPQEGRALAEGDAGAPVAMLEHHFADYFGIPVGAEVHLTGGATLRSVGEALSPEYFIVTTDEGGFFAHSRFAVVFTSLETAQEISGHPGVVNDLVLTLSPEADIDRFADVLEARLSDVGATVSLQDDDLAIRTVREDPEGDRQVFTVIAIATFVGAAFAAFNLTARTVEAQRREIGVGMALGVPPWRIALRPLLAGAQIALLGVVFGVIVGWLIGTALGLYIESTFPSVVWETPFQVDRFATVAVLGFLVPFLATAYPVWRAVRVTPVQAIRVGHLTARGGGLAPVLAKVPLPGNTFSQLPLRSLLRAPRRTLLTVLGVAAAIAILVQVIGLLDSYLGAVDRGDAELLGDRPSRLIVDLDGIYPIAGPEVTAVLESSALRSPEIGLAVAAELSKGDEEIDTILQLTDLQSELWTPTVIDGELDPEPRGVLIAEKAAADLGVAVGDTITLRHPVRVGAEGFRIEESELPVVGVHPHPFRFVAYMDLRHAGLLGLEGAANQLTAEPGAGMTVTEVRRALFRLDGVAAVDPVTTTGDVIRDLLGQVTGILRIIEGAVLALALLIAFNTATINSDERRREHATMFAFGVPLRVVLAMAVFESFVIGLVATAAGLLGGWLLLRATIERVVAGNLPDILIRAELSPQSLAIALALGVVAVAAAPLLTSRRLLRMNLPATLRVME